MTVRQRSIFLRVIGSKIKKPTPGCRKKRKMGMKVVPLIHPGEEFPKEDPEKFVSRNIPYIFHRISMAPTLYSQGYEIIRGGEVDKESYILLENMEIKAGVPDEPKILSKPDPILLKKYIRKPLVKIGEEEFLIEKCFLFLLYNFFDKKVWRGLGISFPERILGNTEDEPIAGLANILHFFIFLNLMPELIDIFSMDMENIEGRLRESVFPGRFKNICDVYMAARKRLHNTRRSQAGKIIQGGFESEKVFLEDLKEVKTLFDTLQRTPDIQNLGYIFLLNYWMYRIVNMNFLKDGMFPINPEQQLERFSIMTSGEEEENEEEENEEEEDEEEYWEEEEETSDFRYSVKLFLENVLKIDFPLKSSFGEYKGYGYPNCVEDSIFKVFQVLTRKEEGFDVELLTFAGEKLKNYLMYMNSEKGVKDERNRGWNDVVCCLPTVNYNQEGYNIQSNDENVLKLLNTLTETNYESLETWFVNIQNREPKLSIEVEAVYGDDATIVYIDNRFILKIRTGHCTFLSEVSGSSRLWSGIPDEIFEYLLQGFTFHRIWRREPLYSFIRRPMFRLRYLEKSYEEVLKIDDNIIVNINNPEDLIRMKNYRDPLVIFRYSRSTIPIPENFLPDTLTELNMSNISRPLPQSLPKTLNSLILPNYYNHSLLDRDGRGILPPGLESLSIGADFRFSFLDRDGKGILPPSLKTLTISSRFKFNLLDRDGKGILPSGLESLSIGADFKFDLLDREGRGILPPGLKSLHIYPTSVYIPLLDREGKGILPESLTYLFIGSNNILDLSSITREQYQLISRIETMTREGGPEEKIAELLKQREEIEKKIEIARKGPLRDIDGNSILPQGLEYLRTGGGMLFSFKLTNTIDDSGNSVFPPNLKTLYIGSKTDALINKYGKKALPDSLEIMTVDHTANTNFFFRIGSEMVSNLPDSLKELYIEDVNDKIISHPFFPPGLEKLRLAGRFRGPLPKPLPPNLKELTLGDRFTSKIDFTTFPNSLETLIIQNDYYKFPEDVQFPDSLKKVFVGPKGYSRQIR